MRVGVIDYFHQTLPIEKRLKRIGELGFKSVQLWVSLVELGFKLENGSASWFKPEFRPQRTDVTRQELTRLLEEAGLELTMLGPHYLLGEQFSWGNHVPVPSQAKIREGRGSATSKD